MLSRTLLRIAQPLRNVRYYSDATSIGNEVQLTYLDKENKGMFVSRYLSELQDISLKGTAQALW